MRSTKGAAATHAGGLEVPGSCPSLHLPGPSAAQSHLLPAESSLLQRDPVALYAYPVHPLPTLPRLAEHEADVIGLRLMARACFDPSSAPLMLAKLNSKEKQMEQVGRGGGGGRGAAGPRWGQAGGQLDPGGAARAAGPSMHAAFC